MEIIEGSLEVNGNSHTVVYTKRNGKQGRQEIPPARRNYRDGKAGDVVRVEREGNQIISATIPGKEAEAEAPTPRNRGSDPAGGAKWQPRAFAAGPRPGERKPEPGHGPYNFTSYEPGLIAELFNEPPKWSGEIVCELEAVTPLLVGGQQDDRPKAAGRPGSREERPTGAGHCRFMRIAGKPVIPGTSLKGMIRSLMEILSFSGMWPMNRDRGFWRVVTGEKYREKFNGELLLGGFLRKEGAVYSLYPTEISRRKENPAEWLEVAVGKSPGAREAKRYYFRRAHAAQPLPLEPRFMAGLAARLEEQLTPKQEERPIISKRKSYLEGKIEGAAGLPVFYRKEEGQPEELGNCRYFRVAWLYSPFELAWPDNEKASAVDIVKKIFGLAEKDRSFAGRLAFSHCFLEGEEYETGKTVLAGPKPGCLPFYIKQDPKTLKTTSRRISDGHGGKVSEPAYDRASMAGYDQRSSRLRGRKLYWHHQPDLPRPPNDNENVAVILHPLKAGAKGGFTIQVKGLSDAELGCLLEALQLLPHCRHKLGMARPLGLGSVKISVRETRLAEMARKYDSLKARLKPAQNSAAVDEEAIQALRQGFRQKIVASVGKPGQSYYDLPQIRDLYYMLDYDARPEGELTRYMSLEEYSLNLLLPGVREVLEKAGKLRAAEANLKKHG